MNLDIKIPQAGESVKEAEIARWRKKQGDYVERDELILEVETDKATLEVRAESAGVLSITEQPGKTLEVGAVVGTIDTSAKAPVGSPAPVASVPSPQASAPSGKPAAGAATPSAQKALSAAQISPPAKGSGVDGRVTKSDVEKAAASPARKAPPEDISPKRGLEAPAAVVPQARGVRREKMSRLRRIIANRMVEAKQEMALLTTFNEVDMSEVMETRKKYKELFKEKFDTNLGFLSFFTKAVSLALLEYPVVNASVDVEEIVFHDYCDVGIAVATPKGLVVPVIRNAESLSFRQIEARIAEVAKKAREGKIAPEDLEGGTFTITNGGVFGSMLSTPIVNHPQSAILGMHAIADRAVVVGGQVVVRPIMYVALTYDHRIIDGADSVRFLVRVKELLEDPTRLLLGV